MQFWKKIEKIIIDDIADWGAHMMTKLVSREVNGLKKS